MTQPTPNIFNTILRFLNKYKIMVLLVVCVIVFGGVFVSAFTAESMKDYQDRSAGYKLAIPVDAKVSPTDLGHTITFDSHAAVTIYKIPGFGLSENKLFDQSTKDIIRKDYLAAYDLPENAFFEASIAGHKALGVTYQDADKQPVLRMKQYYVLKNDVLYVLTEETPGKFHTLDRMVGSFTFL